MEETEAGELWVNGGGSIGEGGTEARQAQEQGINETFT